MDKIAVSNQTLKEFIDAPFGVKTEQKNLQYEDRYQEYKRNNRIRVEATLKLDEHFFIHVKVPSESQKGHLSYDVVVEFAPPTKKEERETGLTHYYVQFFSNSPGFVYKYATLYKMQGYLIESLYDKFPEGALDTLPDKANKNYDLSYDSSIYYACRFLWDNRPVLLGKITASFYKRVSPEHFFAGVMDTNDVNISRDISKLEQELNRERLTDATKSKLSKNKVIEKELSDAENGKIHGVVKKNAVTSTVKKENGETSGIKKIKAKTNTSSKSSVGYVTKKRAKRSTKKSS